MSDDAGGVSASNFGLGLAPEREAFARWVADTHAPALRRLDADGAHAAGYAAGMAAERERCASICDGIGAGYTGAARRLDGQHATHAAGQRDGANECAAEIRRA